MTMECIVLKTEQSEVEEEIPDNIKKSVAIRPCTIVDITKISVS